MASVEEKIEKLVEHKINELGYELYDVEYAKEGKNFFLRIFIDKADGIDINDCQKVNDEIMDLLDEADYIKEQYFLEISSPGVERVLRKDKHLRDNIGKEITIKLFKTTENKKELEGFLKKFDNETIAISCESHEIVLERKNISLMKIKFHWN